jgi:hypothetical protein
MSKWPYPILPSGCLDSPSSIPSINSSIGAAASDLYLSLTRPCVDLVAAVSQHLIPSQFVSCRSLRSTGPYLHAISACSTVDLGRSLLGFRQSFDRSWFSPLLEGWAGKMSSVAYLPMLSHFGLPPSQPRMEMPKTTQNLTHKRERLHGIRVSDTRQSWW